VTSDLLAADRARRGDERRRRASEARAASGGKARAVRAELGFGEEIEGLGEEESGRESRPNRFYPKSWLCMAHPSEVHYG
jgi:hypothetical protein